MRSMLAVSFALVIGVLACGDDPPPAGSGNPAGVGSRCGRNEDCKTNNCYLGNGGGYCTTTCSNEGSTGECPVDTVCKPIQGGARRCLLVCGSATSCGQTTCPDAFCPTKSSCVSVSNTSLRACEPDPG
jgi:hypothetical protein